MTDDRDLSQPWQGPRPPKHSITTTTGLGLPPEPGLMPLPSAPADMISAAEMLIGATIQHRGRPSLKATIVEIFRIQVWSLESGRADEVTLRVREHGKTVTRMIGRTAWSDYRVVEVVA